MIQEAQKNQAQNNDQYSTAITKTQRYYVYRNKEKAQNSTPRNNYYYP